MPEDPILQKPWYASKTLWFNVLGGFWFFIGPKIGVPELTPEVFSTIIFVGNIILRFITKTEVTIS